MKRRNGEAGKLRRPVKRTKITEGIYGSPIIYVKFVALWGLVLAADHLLEFRFEFLWPFWLLLRSVYDSFKYQGLAFSILFVCVAASSDMVCLFLIPMNWLVFLASTYVWVQYVWHTEKGVCVPTVLLCLVFVYVEAAWRLRDIKHSPFHMDLCRPFAAHCIGYPVVTFGFGFKSYIGYRMRQRRQREVSKDNEFYYELLQEALPPRPDPPPQPPTVAIISTLPDKSSRVVCITPNEPDGKLPNGIVINGIPITPPVSSNAPSPSSTSSSSSVLKNTSRKTVDKGPDRDRNDSESRKSNHAHTNGSAGRPDERKCSRTEDRHKSSGGGSGGGNTTPSNKAPAPSSKTNGSLPSADLEYNERLHSVNDLDPNEIDKDKASKGWNNRCQEGKAVRGSAARLQESTASNCLKEKKARTNNHPQDPHPASPPVSNSPSKDDTIVRLEADIKRLKADLQASRQTEAELRGQMNSSVVGERSARSELQQLQTINDDLANRVHGLVQARQSDKQNLSTLEKRLGDERRQRAGAEAQLAQERKTKRQQEESALHAMANALNKGECTESCRQRRRELEAEVKSLRREMKCKEERVRELERELVTLRQYKEAQSDAEILMSALSAMQEKNQHLENSLKAETRIKLDLFSALGEARRQLELRDNLIRTQDKELEELKGKMAQVLAVMPTETFCSSPQTQSKFRCFSTADEDLANLRSLTESPVSTLDPNATAYTPKQGNSLTSTEA